MFVIETVAFSAADGGEGRTGPSQVNSTFVYRRMITNIGNAYNNATGKRSCQHCTLIEYIDYCLLLHLKTKFLCNVTDES